MARVAIVTGSNKGIGFAIVRSLCKSFAGDVYLTSRDVTRGKEAVEKLQSEGLKPLFHQLDVEDSASIEKLKNFLHDKYGGLDLLVNNAGFAYKTDSKAPMSEQAEITLKCNFWGLLNVCNALFPILKSHARVVHLSSMMSLIGIARCSPSKRAELLACNSIEKVCHYMQQFVDNVKSGVHSTNGWPDTCYGVSKIGVTLLCPLQQKMFDSDKSREDIVVNACCPGYVATDMSSHKGPKTIDEGADTPVYLALLPPKTSSPKGNFVSERVIKALDENSILECVKTFKF